MLNFNAVCQDDMWVSFLKPVFEMDRLNIPTNGWALLHFMLVGCNLQSYHVIPTSNGGVFTKKIAGYLKWRYETPTVYKLYGYGLWIREFPHPQNSRLKGSRFTLHFRYRTKFLVMLGVPPFIQAAIVCYETSVRRRRYRTRSVFAWYKSCSIFHRAKYVNVVSTHLRGMFTFLGISSVFDKDISFQLCGCFTTTWFTKGFFQHENEFLSTFTTISQLIKDHFCVVSLDLKFADTVVFDPPCHEHVLNSYEFMTIFFREYLWIFVNH